MAESQFIEGIEKRYPKELLEKRLDIEGCVLSCFYENPLLMDDYNLEREAFITKDGRFYYGIAKILKGKGVIQFDDAAIRSSLNEQMIQRYDEFNGYETIISLKSLSDMENFEYYIDQLYRHKAMLEMHDKGWDFLKKINIKGKQIRHIDVIKDMTCDEFVSYMENQIVDIEICTTTDVSEEGLLLDIDDDWIEDLSKGFENGVPFERTFNDSKGNPIYCYPALSRQIQGFLPGHLSMMAGYSSVGKSTWWIGVIMALLEQGHRILIISNEEESKKYRLKMLCWLIARYNRYYQLSKKKMQGGDISVIDKQEIYIARDVYRRYKNNIVFVKITKADIGIVSRKIKKYVTTKNVDVVLYDTFKIQVEDMTEMRSDLALVRDTRILDELAQKYNLIALCSLQLAEHTKGKLWLDASTLSNSKQIKEQLENLFLMRSVYDLELDPESKFYLRPYRLEKDENDKWVQKEYEVDCNGGKAYRILFVEKCRAGANSEDTGEAHLLEFDGDHSVFKEVAKCRPRHGKIE